VIETPRQEPFLGPKKITFTAVDTYENSSWAQIKSLVARVDAQVARAAADVGSAADFARHLGIHPVVEPGLMWIAEQVPRGSFPPPYIVYSLFFHHTAPYNNKRE
jgi:hypothetical protein